MSPVLWDPCPKTPMAPSPSRGRGGRETYQKSHKGLECLKEYGRPRRVEYCLVRSERDSVGRVFKRSQHVLRPKLQTEPSRTYVTHQQPCPLHNNITANNPPLSPLPPRQKSQKESTVNSSAPTSPSPPPRQTKRPKPRGLPVLTLAPKKKNYNSHRRVPTKPYTAPSHTPSSPSSSPSTATAWRPPETRRRRRSSRTT